MNKPDSQQRGLAGEYYVASILSQVGYDVGITLGRAKVFDMVVIAPHGKTANLQVKANYGYNDWLASHFDRNKNSVVALVRLSKDINRMPELYILPGNVADDLLTHKYPTHSPRISKADVIKQFKDHDLSALTNLLDR
jgi:hypothetical protein